MISAMRIRKMIDRECARYLAKLVDTKEEKASTEDVPVVTTKKKKVIRDPFLFFSINFF